MFKIDYYIFPILVNIYSVLLYIYDLPIRYDAAPVNARRISFGY